MSDRVVLYDLHQQRAGRHLLVWGERGQWLVVDDEAKACIDRLCAQPCDPPLLLNPDVRNLFAALAARGLVAADSDDHGRASIGASQSDDAEHGIANLTYNITNRCNLRCGWCYNTAANATSAANAADVVRGVCAEELLDPSMLLDWLRDGTAAFSPDADFFILGGEPCLEAQRLAQLVRGLRALSRPVAEHRSDAGSLTSSGGAKEQPLFREILVSTNGTCLTPELLRAFAETATTVQVSLDAATEAGHDAIRGPGVFRRACQTVRELGQAGVPVVLAQTLTAGADAHLEAYFDLALRLGAREVRFLPLRRFGGCATQSAAPDLLRIYHALHALLARRPELRRMTGRDYFTILEAVGRQSRPRENCGLASRVLFLDADGTLYPCPNHRAPAHRLGAICDTPLPALFLHSPILRGLRERHAVSQLPACLACAVRHWCAGDCRAEATALSGNSGAPSPYCAQLRRLLPEVFWQLADRPASQRATASPIATSRHRS